MAIPHAASKIATTWMMDVLIEFSFQIGLRNVTAPNDAVKLANHLVVSYIGSGNSISSSIPLQDYFVFAFWFQINPLRLEIRSNHKETNPNHSRGSDR
jgi:hypothetical protein